MNFKPNSLYIGDNLPVLRGMDGGTVDLIYLDPPFNSKREYRAPIGTPAEGQSFDDTWRWGELDERWLGEIDRRNAALSAVIHAARLTQGDGTGAYLAFMGIRLLELRRVLKPTGSIWLHCDDTANAYLRVCMDAIFGAAQYRNEIVWKRQSSNNAARNRAGRVADHLLFYAGKGATWNGGHHELTDKEKARYRQDERGRFYKPDDLTAPGSTRRFTWRGATPSPPRGWAHDIETLERMDAEGEIIYRRDGTVRLDGRKRYMGDGQKLQSIWTDILRVGNTSKERTGWATQKPLSLLRRIVKASSNPGDIVLDPFAGCATCCVAAAMEGRRWVGIEACDAASDIVAVRLSEAAGGEIAADAYRANVCRRPPKRTDLNGDEPKPNTKPYRTQENIDYLYGRQRGDCAGCGLHYHSKDFAIDHINPKSAGGSNELDNLQLLCTHCNSTKGTGTMGDLWERLRRN